MFGLFKRKKKQKGPAVIYDQNGIELAVGDEVISHRYDLGKCIIHLEGLEYFYEASDTGKRISYTKMVDAITEHQKVTKL